MNNEVSLGSGTLECLVGGSCRTVCMACMAAGNSDMGFSLPAAMLPCCNAALAPFS